MKELLKAIIPLLAAIIVSLLMFSLGTIYSLGYSIWLSVTLKDWKSFFRFWWRLIDGYAASLGHAIFETSIALDMAWNVNGEILEDIVTAKEETTFSQKNITVSSSIGKLELDGKLTKSGKLFSKLLNIVFGQKRHAVDSWLFREAKKEIEKDYFKK